MIPPAGAVFLVFMWLCHPIEYVMPVPAAKCVALADAIDLDSGFDSPPAYCLDRLPDSPNGNQTCRDLNDIDRHRIR